MRLYIVNRERFEHNGRPLTLGDQVELSNSQAARLLAAGAVVEPPEGFTPTDPTEGIADVTQGAAVDQADAGAQADQLSEGAAQEPASPPDGQGVSEDERAGSDLQDAAAGQAGVEDAGSAAPTAEGAPVESAEPVAGTKKPVKKTRGA